MSDEQRLADDAFEGLVLRIIADELTSTYPIGLVRSWDIGNPGAILLERRFLADPNDAARCALNLINRIAESVDEKPMDRD